MQSPSEAVMFEEASNEVYACPHYQRKCQFLTACCGNVYRCQVCHNTAHSSHKVRPEDLNLIICSMCDLQQSVQESCQGCNTQFGKYFCPHCKLFDDEDKGQFHCDGCGLCRLGGRDNYFHCDVCNMCLPKSIQVSHRCVENMSHSNCPVCLEDLHTSKEPCQIPRCQHLVHKSCFDQLIKSCHFYCPSCAQSLIDLTPLWMAMQQQIDENPMTGKFQNILVDMSCRDCNAKSKSSYHVIGLQCPHCNGFNTIRTDEKYYLWTEDRYSEVLMNN